ncbi:hypothetical protein ASPWEDRAFT_62306 [Aspergillus wentii DTO 134E9]|uniref:Sulfatase-modifying factor enzyme domain-containing protein n=1 Tax=Aspergillus wentii DTO 134E9 TaxID=1073089 RepID=A0A1L9R7S4_ASPWE|nr:uncharacterized protein ASPWEDRAFT_62306 [Aspergillus wentii DTO 134E9]KAI9927595.1 hypothetical protein MW887_003214 [Aspergillus wentii]OJJ30972.1 hypothetical protein ASPWEDRAFT_62306 [Aspergillus wentii DTO 134E9]
MASDYVLEQSQYAFPTKPEEYAPGPVPSLGEWRKLWAAWEAVTLKMIPNEALLEKPIPLRNDLIFYLGHIPTFEDIHLERATKEPATEPKSYQLIFERGIDPDVDDPTQCHDHSEVPDSWPTLDAILDYRKKVCARIEALYKTDKPWTNRTIGRALWIGFEHEALHLETFLWMSILSPNIQPPPGPKPDFKAMAEKAANERVDNQWFNITPRTFTIGIDDSDRDDDGKDGFFGWDNERNPYDVTVDGFEAQGRPITNGEYATYLVNTSRTDSIPVTWTRSETPDNKDIESFTNTTTVKTVYGPVPLRLAFDWPVYTPYNDAVAYAEWAGARLPTIHESRSIHMQVEEEKARKNGGSRDTIAPSSQEDIYVDLTGCNTGFQHFHPTPVTPNGNRLCGQGDMGGAYEWTSSYFAPQPGFRPMDIYPGYSADFMDEKHILVTGGSWALHPRLSGKRTFLNWWQKGYPYPWIGIRLVRDASK